MASLSRSLLIAFAMLAGWYAGAQAQTPDMLLGETDGNYVLFETGVAVQAGLPAQAGQSGNCLTTDGSALAWGACGSASEGGAVTRFFERKALAYPSPTLPLAMTNSAPLEWHIVPSESVTDGLIAGPFFTQYDGAFTVEFTQNETLTLTVTTSHQFQDGTSLDSTRAVTYRAAKGQPFTISWTDFSSVTALQADARLAQPVTIAIVASLSAANPASLTVFQHEGGAVSFWQPNDVAAVEPELSDNVPVVESGSGAAGTGTEASRDDHVHPAFGGGGASLSDNVPLAESGSGAAGSGTEGSRDDHVHPARSVRQLPGNPSGTANTWLKGSSSGAAWVGGEIAPHFTSGNHGDCLRISNAGTILWQDCPSGGGGASLSDNTPVVESGSGAAGTGTAASRDDHAHPVNPAVATNRTDIDQNTSAIAAVRQVPTPPSTDGRLMTSVNGTLIWSDLFGNKGLSPPQGSDGKFVRIANDLSTASREFVYDDPHSAVLDGLPALTGHGGNCLKANSSATGLEFAECGGGGGGGGGNFTLSLVETITGANTTKQTHTFTAGDCTALLATDLFAVRLRTWTGWQTGLAYLPDIQAGQYTFATTVADDDSTSSTVGIFVVGFTLTPAPTDGSFQQSCTISYEWFGAAVGSSFSVYTVSLGGGGGGGDTPSIPAPTAAGALKHLRVNTAGAAYELADPPEPSSATPQPVAAHGTAGTASAFARGDHAHATPATAGLAYRQVNSTDVRMGSTGYGFWLPAGGDSLLLSQATFQGYSPWTVYINDGTYTPLGYDPARPGLLLDGDNGRFNANGVDFSAATSGSTLRQIKIIVQVQVDNARRYTSSEAIIMKMLGKGRATDDGTQKELAAQTIHMSGGDHQGPVYFTFTVNYSAAPRAGTQDEIWFQIGSFGPGDITVQTSGSRLRQTLPGLQPRPMQQTIIEGSSTIFPAAADVPAGVNLGSTPTLYFHQIVNPDTSGKNEPSETDHSDWTKALNGSVITGYIAAQDLSTLHITAAHGGGAVSHSGGSVWLVRSRNGNPEVLARADHVVNWSIDWVGHGVLGGDRFYLLGDKRDGTAGRWTWNADLVGTQRRYVVTPGYLDSQEYSFAGSQAGSVTLAGLAPIAAYVQGLRFHASDRVQSMTLNGLVIGRKLLLDRYFKHTTYPYATVTVTGNDVVLTFRGTNPDDGADSATTIPVQLVDIDYVTEAGR